MQLVNHQPMSWLPSGFEQSPGSLDGRGQQDLIAKLIDDNEELLRELSRLDAALRQASAERESLRSRLVSCEREMSARANGDGASARLLASAEAEACRCKEERQQEARQHATERHLLARVFEEIEEQLTVARSERRATTLQWERERSALKGRVDVLEEQLRRARFEQEHTSARCEAQLLAQEKQFKDQIAQLQIETEHNKLDKVLLQRLETDMLELRHLSAMMIDPLPTPRSNGTHIDPSRRAGYGAGRATATHVTEAMSSGQEAIGSKSALRCSNSDAYRSLMLWQEASSGRDL